MVALSLAAALAILIRSVGAGGAQPQPVALGQGFLFDYLPIGTTIPQPITQQCEVIHLHWSRDSATGPNPVAPYYMEIFTSAFIVPFLVDVGSNTTFDWAVPFAPGTQYMICMYASNGVTGGCQDIYSVVPNASNSTPSCANVTFPAGAMNVSAGVETGSFSQYGWIPQCSSVSFKPNNGTPPYTLTIAPALRPPMNATGLDASNYNWTNNLAFGLPYFVSMVDSKGGKWSNGPIHSSPGDSVCLLDSPPSKPRRTHTGAIAGGSAVAGLVLGTLFAGVAFWVHSRHRRRRMAPSTRYMRRQSSKADSFSTADPLSPVLPMHGSEPRVPTTQAPHPIEPSTQAAPAPAASEESADLPSFLPDLDQSESGVLDSATSPTSHSHESSATEARRAQVYVVHHDGGRPPVTVFTDDGAQVTELPPFYRDDRSRRDAPSPAPRGPRVGRNLPRPPQKSQSADSGPTPVLRTVNSDDDI